jgi:hypothetical protein
VIDLVSRSRLVTGLNDKIPRRFRFRGGTLPQKEQYNTDKAFAYPHNELRPCGR